MEDALAELRRAVFAGEVATRECRKRANAIRAAHELATHPYAVLITLVGRRSEALWGTFAEDVRARRVAESALAATARVDLPYGRHPARARVVDRRTKRTIVRLDAPTEEGTR